MMINYNSKTMVTMDEINSGVSDEKGGIYSDDYKRLLMFDEKKREKGSNGKMKNEYTIQSKCEVICNNAFEGCIHLTKINLSSVKHIGSHSFYSCEKLESVTTSNTVEHIGKYAFRFCRNLREMRLSDKMTVIEDGVFCDCTSLRKVYNMPNVKEIKNGSFMNCWRLTEINFPDALQSIGYCAFADCDCLQCVNLPSSTVYIGESAFANCINLKTVNVGNATVACNAFWRSSRIQQIIVENNR